ncbi:MAG: uracil-DNA glycosylase [Hyphomicrobium sp.]|uniref:uracil-DNA glycosylase n=1 Tax=Hyphomicrobium sp. TaxID=82 RepID=UPI0039E64CDE
MATAIGELAFGPEAPPKCTRCPRLVAYRAENERIEPKWFNGAVPSFGDPTTNFLIVGLAPGRNGANRTGRPFTGDYAGELLYGTLIRYGFATGEYHARPDDGLRLRNCMITNAVRCVPPENKPEPKEIANCRPFFEARLANLPKLKIILALGKIAHDQTLAALAKRKVLFPFAHGARHELSPGLVLFDSFHCSRYNTNTGRLTTEMFRSVFEAIKNELP